MLSHLPCRPKMLVDAPGGGDSGVFPSLLGMTKDWKRLVFLSLPAMGLLLSSCSRSGREPVFPVRGQVFDAKNQPAAGAMVVFHPVDSSDSQPIRPLAYVDDQGNFELTTYERGDGAPAGEYVVTIEWRERSPHPFRPDKEGKDRLRGEFSDPKTSRFRFAIEKRADNTLPAIYLK